MGLTWRWAGRCGELLVDPGPLKVWGLRAMVWVVCSLAARRRLKRLIARRKAAGAVTPEGD
ncbi:MAG: hypothetical protein Q8N26_03690 [Myxococcales bacterium]|nr:hypothetical protein [Myxococcales bacterium]